MTDNTVTIIDFEDTDVTVRYEPHAELGYALTAIGGDPEAVAAFNRVAAGRPVRIDVPESIDYSEIDPSTIKHPA